MKNRSMFFLMFLLLACSEQQEQKTQTDSLTIIPSDPIAEADTGRIDQDSDPLTGMIKAGEHELFFSALSEAEYKKYYRSQDKEQESDYCRGQDYDSCQSSLEKYYEEKFPNSALRTQEKLSLAVKGGLKIDLKIDTSDSDERIDYYYRGQLKSGFHIVKVMAIESISYLLVSMKDGSKTPVWGFPVESPDHKKILVANYDLMAGFNPNGLQLFNVEDGEAAKQWEKELAGWGPYQVYWKDNQTAYIMQKSESGDGPALISYSAMKINK